MLFLVLGGSIAFHVIWLVMTQWLEVAIGGFSAIIITLILSSLCFVPVFVKMHSMKDHFTEAYVISAWLYVDCCVAFGIMVSAMRSSIAAGFLPIVVLFLMASSPVFYIKRCQKVDRDNNSLNQINDSIKREQERKRNL